MHDPHTGLVKIGRSTDPRVRESTLQSEKPSIKLLFFAPAPAALERQLHARYDDKRVRGEWFRLDPSEIEQIRQELCV